MTERLKNAACIIREQNDDLEKTSSEIKRIAWKIFSMRRRIAFKWENERPDFIPTKKEISFQEFVYTWEDWFGTRLIHWEDWSDICEEGLALTLKFIESDLEDATEMEGYKNIIKKKSRRKTELQKSDKYTELQKRCWDDMGH